jgi:ABC-2 type transport system permease protein
LLRTQVTRARVISLVLLSGLGIVVGASLGAAPRVRDHVSTGADFINNYGLSLLVPVATLVFASSVFGDLNDDSTLVYLWLRPVPRRTLAGAGALTALSITWPLVVPPLAVSAALTKGGQPLVLGTIVAATVGVLAYTGLFLALGARVRRPLVWGLLYIFIWEGFVARGSENAAKVAVRAYGSSILTHYTGAQEVLGSFSLTWSIFVPLVAGACGLAYTVHRLRHQDVA